jgi:hypothetical protein
LLAWPAELVLDMDMASIPQRAEAFVSLAGLAGRTIRNPVLPILREHGLLDPEANGALWFTGRSGDPAEAQAVGDPNDEKTAAGQFRARLTDYVTSDQTRERALMRDVRARLDAFGLVTPPGCGSLDFHAWLLDNPWKSLELSKAAAIQVVSLRSEPGPPTLKLEHPAAHLNGYNIARRRSRQNSRRQGGDRSNWPRVAGYR